MISTSMLSLEARGYQCLESMEWLLMRSISRHKRIYVFTMTAFEH
jgi:hypothetical protein